MSGVTGVPEGITNPPIDELLSKVDSKYALVLYSAKRARQINAYYSQLGEGLLEYVGPLVDTHVQEKPLSIAMREINADLLTYERFQGEIDPNTGMEVAVTGVDNGLTPQPAAPFDAALPDAAPAPEPADS